MKTLEADIVRGKLSEKYPTAFLPRFQMTDSPNQFKISLFWEQITVILHCMTFIIFFFSGEAMMQSIWSKRGLTLQGDGISKWGMCLEAPFRRRSSPNPQFTPRCPWRGAGAAAGPAARGEPRPGRAGLGCPRPLPASSPGTAPAGQRLRREGGGCVLHPRNCSLIY